MPTYEYRCDACEDEFEVEKRMSDPVQAPCPSCGSARTHRLISHSSFVLKGSGWYVTDYARKNGGNGTGGPGKPGGNGKKDGTPHPAADGKAGTTPVAPPAAAAAPTSSAPAAAPATTPSTPSP